MTLPQENDGQVLDDSGNISNVSNPAISKHKRKDEKAARTQDTSIEVNYSNREEEKVTIELPIGPTQYLSKAQVVETLSDPTWNRSRKSLFAGYWLAMVLMLVGAVVSVITSGKSDRAIPTFPQDVLTIQMDVLQKVINTS